MLAGMFTKALVALDLSDAEAPILNFLPELQDWGVEKLVLAHMTEPGIATCAAIAYQRDFENWLEKCAFPLRKSGFEVETSVIASADPARDIVALSQRLGCNLIVMGSRSKNRHNPHFVGSFARVVIQNTTLPLLLQWIEPTARETQAWCEEVLRDTLSHILFATDFSPITANAQKAMLQLAPRSIQVECVHVLQEETNAIHEELAQRNLNDIEKEIEAQGCKASSRLLHGKPAEEIAHLAKANEVSLIVVGKKDNFGNPAIGSTATRLIEISGRPVFIVP